MGAWDVGALENDEALDFIAEWQEGQGYEPLDELLDEVLDLGDAYLEAPLGSRVVAAGAVVSAVVNDSRAELFEDDDDADWLADLPTPSVAMLNKLVRALKRVKQPESELREEWEESEDYASWQASVNEIIADLT